MLNYERYNELNATIKALQKELDTLKEEIKNELKAGPSVVIDDKIIFSDGTAKLTISENKTIKSTAWELVNAAPDPSRYINYGTRENLTIKH